MGYGIPALILLNNLSTNGYFRNFKSIIDLGSQDILFSGNKEYSHEEVKKLTGFVFPDSIMLVRSVYSCLGFTTYKCIDLDGRHGSLVLNLNKDFKMFYNYAETFDLVVNMGTTEHCFNQAQCFVNIHNLCKENGIMIHCLPTQGTVNHGFYCYHPQFFTALASANKYDLLGMWLTIDEEDDLFSYSSELIQLLFNKTPTKRQATLFSIFIKRSSNDFVIPFDPSYSYNFIKK